LTVNTLGASIDELQGQAIWICEKDGVIAFSTLGILVRRIEDRGPDVDEQPMKAVDVGRSRHRVEHRALLKPKGAGLH
jgi:hypothetical protein